MVYITKQFSSYIEIHGIGGAGKASITETFNKNFIVEKIFYFTV